MLLPTTILLISMFVCFLGCLKVVILEVRIFLLQWPYVLVISKGSCGDHQKSNINELIWKYQTVVYLHLFIWHPLHILWLYFESLKAPSWIVDNTSSFSSIKLLVVPLCCVQGGFYLMIIYIYDILSITTNKHFGKCMFAKVRHFILF